MTAEVEQILKHPKFRAACEELRADHARMVEEVIELTEIPAPSFAEEVRGRAYEERMRATGLEDVEVDAIGNVLGLRRGRGNGSVVVVAAHLDTVFPAGTPLKVRREGTRLYAPGIGDDTRSLAVLLAFARALDRAGLETEHDILFLGDVGEEGKGDLRGTRHFFKESRYRDKVVSFFTVDSPDMDKLVTTGVGSKRYRLAIRGPGGHSFGAHGTVNPAFALGHVIAGLSQIELPLSPKTTCCASVIGGGTSINSIPEEVWAEIDLRSVANAELQELDEKFHALVREAVERENATRSTEFGAITAIPELVGDRPGGETAPDASIVRSSLAALKAFGITAELSAASTDANVPMSLGIPALKIGSGGTGGRAHSIEEWIDVEIEESLKGMSATLAAILAVAGTV